MKPALVSLVLLFQLMFASLSFAQQQHELRTGLSHVLSLGSVSDELEMTENQRDALAHLWLTTEIELKAALQKFSFAYSENLPENEIDELKAEFADSIAEIRENENKIIQDVLSDSQIERLKQIRFQYLSRHGDGLSAIKEELSLSESQLGKIRALQSDFQKDLAELQKNSLDIKVPRDEMMHNAQQFRAKYEDKLLDLLTPNQRRKLESLQGKRFEFQYGPKDKPDSDGEDGEN